MCADFLSVGWTILFLSLFYIFFTFYLYCAFYRVCKRLKVKGVDIYIPRLAAKPEQQRFTIRSGVLTSTSSRRRGAISGTNGLWIHSLQLDRPTYAPESRTMAFLCRQNGYQRSVRHTRSKFVTIPQTCTSRLTDVQSVGRQACLYLFIPDSGTNSDNQNWLWAPELH